LPIGFLKQAGCGQIRGFLISHPVEANDMWRRRDRLAHRHALALAG
jgi:hypothetical protein